MGATSGCGYCQPCLQEINIPNIFEAMNYHRVWGLTEHARSMYQSIEPNAEACIECGQCEEQCPQNTSVIEQLQESHAVLSE